ncbi:MAG: preprotein translocase subunit SecG [Victivallaceae bacterium]|nr:preprotein translocase subunit SecG [Victivallaceae bacterium]
MVMLYALVAIVALLLIGLILIQPSDSGGMGAACGGSGESAFGGKAGSHLPRATVWMTAVFLVLALLLAVLIGRGVGNETSSLQQAMSQEAPETVAPAETPAPETVPAVPEK